MRRFFEPSEVPADWAASAVTIGKFDGVHAGHRAVIGELRTKAETAGLRSVVVTFDRHPLRLLAPEKCPESLTSNEQKLELLEEAGVDATLMLRFDEQRSGQEPEDFVREVLVGALRARLVLVGEDFRFGRRGRGDVELLRRLGAEHGFRVELIPDVRPDGERRASSTWIRELLEQGRVREVSLLLGRHPSVRSTVVRGEQRGRLLGFPTANLHPQLEGFLPADGVYAGYLVVDGERHPAAISIGNNPTFEGVPARQLEAWAIDRDFDLYDRRVEVEFVEYLRPMQKFDGIDPLIAQLKADEADARRILDVPAAPQER